MLPRKPTGRTETGFSAETEKFLNKLMAKKKLSAVKQKQIKRTLREDGTLHREAPPKPYQVNRKPRPERKVFTMARVGKKPLQKSLDRIISETNNYEPEQAPYVPVGPSNEEKRQQLYEIMAGIQHDLEEVSQVEYVERTLADQLIEEIQDRTAYLEEMHAMGIHKHDAETLRQIDRRMEELRALD